ncbi:flagellar biosynthetic protein FliR [Vagococcus penaei]|nr:flagellar biosynthetic protein FliR [Vagococcus penaei]RSU06714.1 flagellar biosynthetic protein FliR [Vagococcus penaei]
MTDVFVTFILIFTRLTAFMVTSPGFSFRNMPKLVKIMLSLGLALLVIETMEPVTIENNLFLLYLLVIKEILIGLSMGFITQILFSAIEMAGQLIDFQVGFSMGMIYDPSSGVQASNYGRFYYWLGLAVFFMTDFHLIILQTVINSFRAIPLGTYNINSGAINGTIMLFGESFKLALMLAAPMLIVALIVDVVLGIISRSVSQINVLMIGLPFKIFVTLLFMLALLPSLFDQVQHLLPTIQRYLQEFIQSISG